MIQKQIIANLAGSEIAPSCFSNHQSIWKNHCKKTPIRNLFIYRRMCSSIDHFNGIAPLWLIPSKSLKKVRGLVSFCYVFDLPKIWEHCNTNDIYFHQLLNLFNLLIYLLTLFDVLLFASLSVLGASPTNTFKNPFHFYFKLLPLTVPQTI